ncbi:MAG: hypothetical protein RIR00_2089, partial [Pseudomonadota bacterium]
EFTTPEQHQLHAGKGPNAGRGDNNEITFF